MSEEELIGGKPMQNVHVRAYFAYIRENEDRIYVRAQVDGKWQSVPLSQVSPMEWANYIVGWLERGWVPVAIKEGMDGEPEGTASGPEV